MSLFTRARRWQLGTMLYALVLVGQLPGAGLTSGATAGTTGHSSSGPLRLQPVRPSRHLGHGLSRTRFGALPLRFERMADAPDAGLFAARGPGYSLMIGPAGMTLALLSASGGHTHLPLSAVQNKVTRGLSPHHIPALAIDIEAATVPHVGPASVHLLRWRFLGANAHAQASPLSRLPGHTAYLVGRDRRTWRTAVPGYARVRYRNLYPGIDLVYYGHTGQVEYDIVAGPGARVGAIRFAITGARSIHLNRSGGLAIATPSGTPVQHRPVAYQVIGHRRRPVNVRYAVSAIGEIGFAVAAYDHRFALIIDPVLTYSSYLGGSNSESLDGVAVDAQGNTYLAGYTYSPDLQVQNAYQASYGGIYSDAFVAKLDPTGTNLMWATYLGGSGTDVARGIAVDAQDIVYMAGYTSSSDFPTQIPIQSGFGGGTYDAFISALAPDGSSLSYSTYLGGSGNDTAQGVAIDATGAAYVAGYTSSPDYPTQAPFQDHLRGRANAFVAKVAPGGASLAYSTYLGGSALDDAMGVAVDAAGHAYVVGSTTSSDFPTEGAVQAASGGGRDGFVARVTDASSDGGIVPFHAHYRAHLGDALAVNVDLTDGHVDVSAVAMALPARGLPLAVANTWDSLLAQAGLGQSGWSNTLSPRIDGQMTGIVTYRDETGTSWAYTYAGSPGDTPPYSNYISPAGSPWALTATPTQDEGSPAYILTNKLTGDVRQFDRHGHFLADGDVYGNLNTLSTDSADSHILRLSNSGARALTLMLDDQGRLSEVQSPLWVAHGAGDPASQHAVYAYNDDGSLKTLTRAAGTGHDLTTGFSYTGWQLTGITTPAGESWTLQYDDQGRLTDLISPATSSSPSFTTHFDYVSGQTTVTQGQGSDNPVEQVYTFDANRDVTSVSDNINPATHTEYDIDHNLTKLTDANGNVTTFQYDYVGPAGPTGTGTIGLLREVDQPPLDNSTDPVVTSYYYDQSSYDLLQKISPNGASTYYTYDSPHNLKSVIEQTDQAGCGTHGCSGPIHWRATVYSRDSTGQLRGVVNPRGVTVDPTNGTDLPTATVADPADAYLTSYDYTDAGDLRQVTSPQVPVQLANGTSTSQALVQTYTPDDGNVASAQASDGSTTNYSHDHAGRLTRVTEPSIPIYSGGTASPTVTLVYDRDGRLLQHSDALNDTTTYVYDPFGRVTSVTDPENRVTKMAYTATGLQTVTDALQQQTIAYYDGAGRLDHVTDPLNITTSYSYDANGNVKTIKTPLVAPGEQGYSVTTLDYNKLSDVTGRTVTSENVSTPYVSQHTGMIYDPNGNLTSLTMPGGDSLVTAYDALDRPTGTDILAANDGSALISDSRTYDQADNLSLYNDLQGRQHHFTYDALDRPQAQTDTDCSDCGTPTLTLSTGYDLNGYLNALSLQMDGSSATPTYRATYNTLGLLTQETQDDGAGTAVTTHYAYDAALHLRSYDLPVEGGTVTLTPNANGLDTQLDETATDPSSGQSSSSSYFTYDELNRLGKLDIAPQSDVTVSESRSYDADSRLTDLSVFSLIRDEANQFNQSYHYTYDQQHHITSIADTSPGGSDPTWTFLYNAGGQLAVRTLQGSIPTSLITSYDANGNITSDGGKTYSYTYPTADTALTPTNWLPGELTTATLPDGSVDEFGYDNNGATHTISHYPTASASEDLRLTTQLTYNARGLLSRAEVSDALVTRGHIDIAYNAQGLRQSYTVTPIGHSVGHDWQPFAEQFVYQNGRVAQVRVSGTSAFTETFVYRQDGQPLELLYQEGGQLQRFWYLLDGQGNVIGLSDVHGHRVATYVYDAWGYQQPSTSEDTVHQPLRYRGYWYDGWDNSTGEWNQGALPWYWLRVRNYDPGLRRFLQPDPLMTSATRDYIYAQDDPVDLSDPSGLAPGQGGQDPVPVQLSLFDEPPVSVVPSSVDVAMDETATPLGLGNSDAEAKPDSSLAGEATVELTPRNAIRRFKLSLAEGWQQRILKLAEATDRIIYQVVDTGSTTVLKVGSTMGGGSRFTPYRTAGDNFGINLEVHAWVVDTGLPGRKGLSKAEGAFRDAVEASGETLPWDNEGGRLGRIGPGVPFVRDSALAKLGYHWDGDRDSVTYGRYLDASGAVLPQEPDYYPSRK
ncbi:MAG TPA: SBBP repeat-containing protein [Chloroflexota bacterium]|nr:SBBP repeat-containing protein [Chloroflexota bacterium]